MSTSKLRKQTLDKFISILKTYGKKSSKTEPRFVRYSKELEKLIYIKYPDQEQYKTKAIQLAYNLSVNGKNLYQKYDPSKLINLTSTELTQGTLIEQLDEARKKQMEMYNNILQMNSVKSDENSDLKCPKCKSSNVVYTLQQRRSADEPMTVLCRCKICKTPWMMN